MRIYLYSLAGITSALIGWNLGQFFLADLGLFQLVPEIVLFPCIAISLAIGMVMNEIFISNPTRAKLSFRRAKIPMMIAICVGLVAGLLAGGISQILFLPQVNLPTPLIRTLGWLLIGSSVGLAEGLTWSSYSIEAADKRRKEQRRIISIIAASGASLVAALLFELIRLFLENISPGLKAIEDPLGFSILGLLLGLVFNKTNSPSYLAALRAGAGFEYLDFFEDFEREEKNQPYIDTSRLRFVSNPDEEIEEGLSIELPHRGKITIGSDASAEICIPGLPPQIAQLDMQARETFLIPEREHIHSIEVNGEKITARRRVALKHNYILTFYSRKQDGDHKEKIYRFVYYNRFLDPQA
ncbi:MAG: hypothetical protein F6J92_22560 [Symploca sp. SIO1A3]|nr:hypothetical protein [Symploca sp. SIO1A3]